MSDIDRALDDLAIAERVALAVAAAEKRDAANGAGERRMAAFWNALACAAADSRDRERALLRTWEDDLNGGIVTFGED
jgi:hypothetical protein